MWKKTPTPEINASEIDPTLQCHKGIAAAIIKGKIYGEIP